MFDGEAFGQQMVEIVRGYVDAELAALASDHAALARRLEARIAELEARELLLPEKGDPGEPGTDGAPGEPGRNGEPGKDGIGLADALIDKDGNLVLTMTDGRTKSLCQVVGRDGQDGAPGAAFTLDDFDMVPLSERAFDFRFTHGGECHSFEVKFDVPLYRGVFKEAGEYERGDMVTWAGSTWHCDEPKGLKPGAPDSGWTLAVKAGRAGK